MNRTDRKPGVKLVTDPPARKPKLTIRIDEADAPYLLQIHAQGQPRSTAEWAALSRLAKAVEVSRQDKGRMGL